MSALARVLDAYDAGQVPERADEREAVKSTLAELARRAPGRSVEIRIPPYAAIQAVPGGTHRRGTPPAVVECDARTWLELVSARLAWPEAAATGRLRASGERSDLSAWLPLTEAPVEDRP